MALEKTQRSTSILPVSVVNEECSDEGYFKLARSPGLPHRVDHELIETHTRRRVDIERGLLGCLFFRDEGE